MCFGCPAPRFGRSAPSTPGVRRGSRSTNRLRQRARRRSRRGNHMTDRKVALVTGSGKKRVGNRVAEALAARDYSLVIHYRTSATEAAETAEQFARAHGVPVHTVRADLANEAEVKLMVAESITKFGRIDVLVNCAAIWNRKRLEDVT